MESIFEEKHDEEEGELRKWETTDKKTKYIKNAHGQTKLKVSAPLTIQKKVITSVKEKIEKRSISHGRTSRVFKATGINYQR